MKFSLLILGAPYSSQSVQSALRFAQAALAGGHEVLRVFFYHDAVNIANALITPPQDEPDLPREWAALAEQHDLDLVVCIASALKRGVLDEGEAKRYQRPAANLARGFEISGLGQLTEAALLSDRLVTFGP